MIVRFPILSLLYFVVAFVPGLPFSSAWGQFEDPGAENPGGQQGIHQQGMFAVPNHTIDQWIYGNSENAKKSHARLESMASLQIEAYDSACQLVPKQKEVLWLAAQGDIKRFEDRVEVVREKFKRIKNDQQKFNQIWQDIQPLTKSLHQGLFRKSSLLQKVTVGILDSEQLAKYEEAELERRTLRYQAKIGYFIIQLQNSIPMQAEQRKQFTELLLNETNPPMQYGSQAYYVVLVMASRIPEEKMKKIFDDAQWIALNKTLRRGQGMERHFIQQGFIEIDVPVDPGK